MTVEQLQDKVTDERVVITESEGIYFADVVEENGDEDRLAQAEMLEELHEQLVSFSVADK